jgi:hypothetical protein
MYQAYMYMHNSRKVTPAHARIHAYAFIYAYSQGDQACQIHMHMHVYTRTHRVTRAVKFSNMRGGIVIKSVFDRVLYMYVCMYVCM